MACRTQAGVEVRALDGTLERPLEEPGAAAIVLLFVDPQCPISNAYAPEILRLHQEFAPRGVAFDLVYADPDRSEAEVRRHVDEFGYTMTALLDPEHRLVARAGATVTPEAALFLPDGALVYHGRIDDRFVELGKQRAAPTRRDLRDALEAVLRGASPAEAST